jgi:hypothetical protein
MLASTREELKRQTRKPMTRVFFPKVALGQQEIIEMLPSVPYSTTTFQSLAAIWQWPCQSDPV